MHFIKKIFLSIIILFENKINSSIHHRYFRCSFVIDHFDRCTVSKCAATWQTYVLFVKI